MEKNKFLSAYEICFLQQIRGIGFKRIQFIVNKYYSFNTLKSWTVFDWKQIKGINPKESYQDFHNKLKDIKLQRRIENTLSFADKVISFWDTDYPPLLREIYNPPSILFCKGNHNLLKENCIAVIGSRKITSYGKEITRQISHDLLQSNITIASGFALGVDSIAHHESIAYDAKTIAVLGSGLNIIYPKSNGRLYRSILERKGLILSEFLFNTKPDGINFPKRNRIISGLSKAVIVVEAGKKSGALITAEMALEQGRDVFAVPGPINSEQSNGTNYLIQQGAYLYQSIDDIKNHIEFKMNFSRNENRPLETKPIEKLNPNEKILYDIIFKMEIHVDDLQIKSKIPIQDILANLLKLEIMGFVKQLPNKNYVIS